MTRTDWGRWSSSWSDHGHQLAAPAGECGDQLERQGDNRRGDGHDRRHECVDPELETVPGAAGAQGAGPNLRSEVLVEGERVDDRLPHPGLPSAAAGETELLDFEAGGRGQRGQGPLGWVEPPLRAKRRPMPAPQRGLEAGAVRDPQLEPSVRGPLRGAKQLVDGASGGQVGGDPQPAALAALERDCVVQIALPAGLQ
jgi:hypothetical protein